MTRLKKNRPDEDVLRLSGKMMSLKVRGAKLITKNIGDRVEIILQWEDKDMEKQFKELQEQMNELVKRKANRGTGQGNAGKGHKRKA